VFSILKTTFTKETMKSYSWFLLFIFSSIFVIVLKGFLSKFLLISNIIQFVYLITLYWFVAKFLSKRIFKQQDQSFFKVNLIYNTTAFIIVFVVMYSLIELKFGNHLPEKISTKTFLQGFFAAFCAAFIEEIIFRYILLSNFIYYKKHWLIPVIIASLLFSMLHLGSVLNPLEIYLLYTFLMGLFFSMVFWIYRNIWLGITIHFAINFYDKIIENGENSSELLSPFMLTLPIVLMIITLLFNFKKLKKSTL
jgi:membrane protease YdiL (CAAX protease family)